MRIALWSVCTVLALAIGCVTDDALFLQGDPPLFGDVGGSDVDCQIDLKDGPPAGDRDARPAIPAFTGMKGRVRVGVGASAQRIGFNTAGCEVRTSD